MHIKREVDKRISAYQLGEQDGRNGRSSNSSQVRKSERKAYSNGFIEGQKFRKPK